MKILAVSDIVDDHLYSSSLREDLPGVDLVLGCGDLPREYLEFLVTVFNVPLLYVPGNHDPEYDPSHPAAQAEGCENIDQRGIERKGLLIAGLGGCIKYKPHALNQYSQIQMWRRAFRLASHLVWSTLVKKRNLDIMIAHSPPRGIHEDDDPAHQGFASFLWLLRIFQPRYFLHGHTLNFRNNLAGPIPNYHQTRIVNVNPYLVIEMESHVR